MVSRACPEDEVVADRRRQVASNLEPAEVAIDG